MTTMLVAAAGAQAAPLRFSAAAGPQARPGPYALADVTADGLPDLFAGGGLLVNDDSGAFHPWQPDWIDAHAYLAGLPGADFNEDAKIDLVTSVLETRRTTGAATFAAPVALPGAGETHSDQVTAVRAGRVTGDAHADVVGIRTKPRRIQVWPGKGDGTFNAAVTTTFAGDTDPGEFNWSYEDIAVGDLDADGVPDLLLGDIHATGGGRLRRFTGQGNGTFTEGAALALPASIGPVTGLDSITIADLDGDGDPDIALLAGGHPVVLRNDGTGAFTPSAVAGGGNLHAMAVADLDRDGTPDLAGVELYDAHPRVQHGNGDGTFALPRYACGAGPGAGEETDMAIAAGDVDGDGDTDLLFSGVGYGVEVLLADPAAAPCADDFAGPTITGAFGRQDAGMVDAGRGLTCFGATVDPHHAAADTFVRLADPKGNETLHQFTAGTPLCMELPGGDYRWSIVASNAYGKAQTAVAGVHVRAARERPAFVATGAATALAAPRSGWRLAGSVRVRGVETTVVFEVEGVTLRTEVAAGRFDGGQYDDVTTADRAVSAELADVPAGELPLRYRIVARGSRGTTVGEWRAAGSAPAPAPVPGGAGGDDAQAAGAAASAPVPATPGVVCRALPGRHTVRCRVTLSTGSARSVHATLTRGGRVLAAKTVQRKAGKELVVAVTTKRAVHAGDTVTLRLQAGKKKLARTVTLV